MQLSTFFSEKQVILETGTVDKEELFDKLVAALELGGKDAADTERLRTELRAAIRDRENQESTGVGEGLAFPHARIPGLDRPHLAIALLRTPIDYGSSVDDLPVDIVCLAAVPTEAPTVFLKMMALLVRFFCRPDRRQALKEAASAEAAYRVLAREDMSVDIPVIARDIMKVAPVSVHAETPLKDVTRQMLEHSLSAVPVAGSDGQIVGEITCDILFRYGLPDFFTRLKSVAFIREFDPFEKYFEKEADSVAGDVMSDHPAVMPPTATLLEIVFALAVEKHMNVYIVAENGALVGVIDRAAVLDRILNL